MIKRLHRYLLVELLKNGLLTLAVVLFIFFLITLAIILGRSRSESIPFHLVVEHSGYLCIATLYLTVPMTVLTACLFTYGRFKTDGEFTAIRVAGVHPYRVIAPALVFGAAVTLLLAWLQDEVMPEASLQGRVELTQDLVRNVEGILKRSTRVVEASWKATWDERGEDADGKLILHGFEVVETDKKTGEVTAHTYARSAKPVLDRPNDSLIWELSDLERIGVKGGEIHSSKYSFDLPLEAIASDRTISRKEHDRTYADLLSRAERKYEYASLAASPKERRSLVEDARDSRTGFHFRIAFAYSSVLFALFGAALGLQRGLGNRIVVFIVGFLIVVAAYYPLELFGRYLGKNGALHPAGAVWIGNIALLVGGGFLYRETVKA